MLTCAAALLKEAPGKLSLQTIEVDDPKPNEVQVRVVAAGLCHSDLHVMTGHLDRPLPTIIGHEIAGVVSKVGSAVHDLAEGDHVVACLSGFCGICRYCVEGQPSLCPKLGLARDSDRPRMRALDGSPIEPGFGIGGFSEYTVLHRNFLTKIIDSIPLKKAAILGCASVTGLGAIFNTAKVRPGDTVAVIGCGGVGLNAIQGATIAGASEIIAIDIDENKFPLAQTLGATRCLQVSDTLVDEVIGLTEGGVNFAIEAVGRPDTIRLAFDVTETGGSAIVIGMVKAGAEISIDGSRLLRGRSLRGSLMGSNRFPVDIPKYVSLYQRGVLNLDDLITGEIPLDDINSGFEALASGSVGRTVVVFDGKE